MPKAPKTVKPRHDPLHVDLEADAALRKFGRVSAPGRRKGRDDEDDGKNVDAIADVKSSKRILDLAREQLDELQNEDAEDDWADEPEAGPQVHSYCVLSDQEVEIFSSTTRPVVASRGEDGEEYVEGEGEADLEIDPADHAMLDALAPEDAVGEEGEKAKTLADIIFSKIEAGPSGAGGIEEEEEEGDALSKLDPKLRQAYTTAGKLLRTYRKPPLPRLMKILAGHPFWRECLLASSPETWSPIAMKEMTSVYISNLKPAEAREFLEYILLPAVRENVRDNRGKLNVHLYEALKKSLYKPSAFFKGIVHPLMTAPDPPTLKEAVIVASVISKMRIPMAHAGGALWQLAQADYTGPNSLVIRVLLDKKHALAYQVLDELVFHFIRLANSSRSQDGDDKLPVLWHQSLLVFVQHYASDLTQDQKDALLDVIRVRPHYLIGPEIRREIVASVPRGAPRPGDEDVVMGGSGAAAGTNGMQVR